MGTDQVITLGRGMLIEVALLVAPLLLITVAVSQDTAGTLLCAAAAGSLGAVLLPGGSG